MKHSIFVKFIAVLLTAISLVAAIGGVLGIIAMESSNLYVDGVDKIRDNEYRAIADAVAKSYANYYTAKHLSNLSFAARESLYPNPEENRGDAEHWLVQIWEDGALKDGPEDTTGFSQVKTYTMAPRYPVASSLSPEELLTYEEDPETENSGVSAYENVIPPDGYLYYEESREWEDASFVTYYYYYYEAPEYQVSVYMRPEALESSAVHILTSMYPYRFAFIVILAVGLLIFAAGMVYLVWTAGKLPDGTNRPGGLNRIPVDGYLIIAGASVFGMYQILARLIRWVEFEGPHLGNLSLTAALLAAMALPGIGVIFAFAAQIKVRGYCWKNTLLCRIGTAIGKLFGGIFRSIGRLAQVMPAVWRGMLLCVVLAAVILAAVVLTAWTKLWVLFGVVIFAGVTLLCYVGYAFGVLLTGATRMAEGDLQTQIPTRFLIGDFAACAVQMNALADVAIASADRQLRSERMRTELITNVSHDIKTPLTSIINYVDILTKPHDETQRAQYLEVLGRQSLRMKKLLEDLVEMSKASSGNITVNFMEMDAVEAVNQALGEFSDKLEKASLQVVFQPPQTPARIRADGRLIWRVLSNLLSNIVKYALPGTRVHVEVICDEETVRIALKNISAQPLKISAEELTERFVRGDESRNTEGSGLGLYIAKDLMRLQKGDLILDIDGDLFKAMLQFPAINS